MNTSNIRQPIQGGKDMLQKSLLLFSCWVTSDSATQWTAARQASLSFTTSWSLLKTHVHWVNDAITPSHPLLFLSPPAFNLTQHQGLFQWVDSLHQVAKVLEHQLQYQSFQWIFKLYFLKDWLVWSPCCPRDSQELVTACLSCLSHLLAAQGTLKSLWLQYLSQSWSFRRSGHNYVEAKTLGESVLWSFDPIFLFPMTEFWMNTTKRQWYSNIWPQDPFTVLRLSKSHLKSFWLDEWYLSTFIIFFIKLETV